MTMQTFYEWMITEPTEPDSGRAWLVRLRQMTVSQIRASVRLFGWEFWGTHS